jgi:hypothetical protein
MSSANHNMIYLISCKSSWGYSVLKMDIFMKNIVLLMTRSQAVPKSYSLSPFSFDIS